MIFGGTNRNTEFSFQWVDRMSVYLGNYLTDIPLEYKQNIRYDEKDNTYSSLKSFSETIADGFIIKDNIVFGAIWMKIIKKQNLIDSEYVKYLVSFNNYFGNYSGADTEAAFWNWNSKIILLYKIPNSGIAVIISESKQPSNSINE